MFFLRNYHISCYLQRKVQNLIQTRLTCVCASTCKIDETYFPNKFEKISNAPFIPGRKRLDIPQYIKQSTTLKTLQLLHKIQF